MLFCRDTSACSILPVEHPCRSRCRRVGRTSPPAEPLSLGVVLASPLAWSAGYSGPANRGGRSTCAIWMSPSSIATVGISSTAFSDSSRETPSEGPAVPQSVVSHPSCGRVVARECPRRSHEYAPNDMPAGSAVRDRSETMTVVTPRGEVEVARQEMRGLPRGSSWTWFWLARRRGSSG